MKTKHWIIFLLHYKSGQLPNTENTENSGDPEIQTDSDIIIRTQCVGQQGAVI